MEKENILMTIKEVIKTLKKGGYDAKSQIVGYLNSGDPGYISSYEGAREKIIMLDRYLLLEILLESFLNN